MAKKSTVKEKGMYEVSFNIGDTDYAFTTNDIVQTLMDVNAPVIKSKVFISIKKGDRSFERMLLPRIARRYFNNLGFAQVFAKNINTMLNS